MDSVFDKQQLWNEHCTSPQSPGQAAEIKYLIALIEIREAIEEGFARLDQTSIEASMMLVGMKESFDSYLQRRLETDKVIEEVFNAIEEKGEQIEEKPEQEVDKPEKSAVTLEVGEIGQTVSESGIS